MILLQNRDYLLPFHDKLNLPALSELLNERDSWLQRKSIENFQSALHATPTLKTKHFQIHDGWVEIGKEDEITQQQKQTIQDSLLALTPWRKGPFRLFGIDLDAEWRSDWKWERLEQKIDSLTNKVICDIGCHNGYYMFRMLPQKPAMVMGIDPIPKLHYQFHMFNQYLENSPLHFEFLGVEHLTYFKNMFDVIFCMGILYHRKNPLETLQVIKEAMVPNGQVIIESAGIPGDDPVCLCPEDTYGKARNVYFLPTVSCLKNWLLKTGFKQVEVIYQGTLTFEEQRKTMWCQSQTLEDFTSGDDPTKTCEGYPSPIRMILLARS